MGLFCKVFESALLLIYTQVISMAASCISIKTWVARSEFRIQSEAPSLTYTIERFVKILDIYVLNTPLVVVSSFYRII